MYFNSWTFLLFALVVFPTYHALGRRGQNVLLLVASYVFYGAWDYRFLSLIVASTLVDYYVSIGLDGEERVGRRRQLLGLSVVFNLGLLGFFKYWNFFAASLHALLGGLGLEVSMGTLHIVLPVGISFYTFQTMGYTIDVYRGQLKPSRRLLDFALYVAYFPQLVAGPIERADRLLPQIEGERRTTRDDWIVGAWLILWGLFKKVVIADNLGQLVDPIFGFHPSPTGAVCLLSLYAFAYQIYCDFSGYTDIARGLARWMGIDLMMNFRRPYVAGSPREFWQRWHISLSTWLRDYLYIPLGGNRGSRARVICNIMITMLLGGLWHGAAWTFVAWGAFHGAMIVLYRNFGLEEGPRGVLRRTRVVLRAVVWFHLTCFGWLLFRATNLEQVSYFLYKIFGEFQLGPAAAPLLFQVVFLGGVLWIFESWIGGADDPRTARGWNRGLGAIAVTFLLLGLLLLKPPGGAPFIYFQF